MNVCVEASFDAAVPGSPGASLVRWFRAARTGLYRALVEAEARSGGGVVSEAQVRPDIDDVPRRFPHIGQAWPQFEEELTAFPWGGNSCFSPMAGNWPTWDGRISTTS